MFRELRVDGAKSILHAAKELTWTCRGTAAIRFPAANFTR
jgi:hypothetical protein